jgi:hypothetical protein
LLVSPATVTDTYPCGTAPLGTVATMLVSLQLVAVAVVPLKFTALVPCVAPKFVPVIVTDVPTTPDVGDKLVTVGAAARTSLAYSNNREKARTGTSFHPLWCINVTSAFNSRGRKRTKTFRVDLRNSRNVASEVREHYGLD